MANRGRHRKRHVKCILHISRYHASWISKVLDDETIDKILNHQSLQTGIMDLSIFEKNPSAGRINRGFTWGNTIEGHDYWEKIMDKLRSYKIQYNV